MSQWATQAVGLDIGKRRLAIGWPAWETSIAFDLGKKPGDRTEELLAMRRWLGRNLPVLSHLWIEQTYVSHGTSGAAVEGLAETIGMVYATKNWAGANRVAQSTWKAQLVGNGHAGKEECHSWLAQAYPKLHQVCVGDEDRMDAMCVGIYGSMRMTGDIQAPTPKPRKKRKPRATPAAE